VTPDAEAYLRKARESLASAEADVKAGRYNSAANRAYYAGFQASVAILVENKIGPRGDSWDHRFVMSQISGKLIRRRKTLPTRLTGTLESLLRRRLRADYRPIMISKKDARESVIRARDFVTTVSGELKE